jgi:hypothetical protein
MYDTSPRAKAKTTQVKVTQPKRDNGGGNDTVRLDGKAMFVVRNMQCGQVLWDTYPHVYQGTTVLGLPYDVACWRWSQADWESFSSCDLMQKANLTSTCSAANELIKLLLLSYSINRLGTCSVMPIPLTPAEVRMTEDRITPTLERPSAGARNKHLVQPTAVEQAVSTRDQYYTASCVQRL